MDLILGPKVSGNPSFVHWKESEECILSIEVIGDDDDDWKEETSGCKRTSSPSRPTITGPFLIETLIRLATPATASCKQMTRRRRECESEDAESRLLVDHQRNNSFPRKSASRSSLQTSFLGRKSGCRLWSGLQMQRQFGLKCDCTLIPL